MIALGVTLLCRQTTISNPAIKPKWRLSVGQGVLSTAHVTRGQVRAQLLIGSIKQLQLGHAYRGVIKQAM